MAQRETELAERVERLEDVRRIRQLIDLNWFLADAGPAEAFVELYTEDCVINLGRLVTPEHDTIVEGHAGVRARYTDHAHSQWEGRSHHVSAGPEAILVDGDAARALTYAVTTMLIDGEPKIILVGFNVWRLRRAAGRWRISHRWARRLGDTDNLELFRPIVGELLDGLQPKGDNTLS
jgi:ketosteroid isomerase-like protein